MEDYKKITNFENAKTLLQDIKLEIPNVPNIKDFGKLVRNRDEKIDFDLSISGITYKKVGDSKYKITRCILSISEVGFYFPLGLIMLIIYILG